MKKNTKIAFQQLIPAKIFSHGVREVHGGGTGTFRLKTEILLNGHNWKGTLTL